MDAKDLRTESALSELNNDGSKYSQNGVALHCDKNKPYQDIGSNSLAKVDVQTTRPCAVIGPDRVVPPSAPSDAYLKKPPAELWSSLENTYHGRRPPEYPHKLSNFQNPTRNISPRQTFQENMPRIMVPPSYNSVKINDDVNFSQIADRNNVLTKNIKLNVQPETKFCDVPYSYYPNTNEQKNLRNPDMCLSSVNANITRTPPHAWPLGGVNIRPTRPYGAPELYQYQEYPNCTGPRFMSRPNRNIPEEPGYVYAEPFYHQEGNLRFKPYPTVKERFPHQRYDYVSNYANSFHPPPTFHSHKYDLQKTVPPQHYAPYPPIKYLDRPESTIDGYQRNSQNSYNMPYHNQVIHPNYAPIIGNSPQNKIHSYPPDGLVKPVPPNKIPYDNAKAYIEYENVRSKMHPSAESYIVNEMGKMHSLKSQVIMPNYPTLNINNIPPNNYHKKDNPHLKNYEYLPAHFRNIDPSLNIHNSIIRHGTIFSPTTLAMSPTDSSASNDTSQTLGTSQEDCGYVSQSSTASVRSIDSGINRIPNEFFRKYYDSRFGPNMRTSSVMSKSELHSNNNSKERKNLNLRQFLQTWNEGDEETEENNSKEVIGQTTSKNRTHKTQEVSTQPNQEQLYVLGLVNVPSEELDKYEHIQKVSKLPENIKGYNHIELLNQFEEAIESSNMINYKMPIPKDYQTPLKAVPFPIKPTTSLVTSRPLSPLDVEAKISQSVIHKEVGCNFEIKPCSPKMLNVEVATPVQNIIAERSIEKVANPVMLKSPRLNSMVDNVDCNMNRKDIINDSVRIPSCKMVNTQFSNHNSMDPMKNCYSLHDLESNSGLGLASLPRLDNDIELNFPEVNQQFINANKGDSTNFVSSIKDLPTLEDLDQSDIQAITEHVIKSPYVMDSEKEFTKLSKYRKAKINLSDSKDNLNATRTDSVIIKNPENSKTCDENFITTDCLIQHKGIQNTPINLTSQGSTTNNMEKNIITQHERKERDTATDIAIDFSLGKASVDIEHKIIDLNLTHNSIKADDQMFNHHLSKNSMFSDCTQENSDVTEENNYKTEGITLTENPPLEDIITNNAYLSALPIIKKTDDESNISLLDTDHSASSSLSPIDFIAPSTECLKTSSDININKSHQRDNNNSKIQVIQGDVDEHNVNVTPITQNPALNTDIKHCNKRMEKSEDAIESELDINRQNNCDLNQVERKITSEDLATVNCYEKKIDPENNSIALSFINSSGCSDDITIQNESDTKSEYDTPSANDQLINSHYIKSETTLQKTNSFSGTVSANTTKHISDNCQTDIPQKVINLNSKYNLTQDEKLNKIATGGQDELHNDSNINVPSPGSSELHGQNDAGIIPIDSDWKFATNVVKGNRGEQDANTLNSNVAHPRSDNIEKDNSKVLFEDVIDKGAHSNFIEKKNKGVLFNNSNSDDMNSAMDEEECNTSSINLVISNNTTVYINNTTTDHRSDEPVMIKSKDLFNDAIDQGLQPVCSENQNPKDNLYKSCDTLPQTTVKLKKEEGTYSQTLRSYYSKEMFSPWIQNLLLFSVGTVNVQEITRNIRSKDDISNCCVQNHHVTDAKVIQEVEMCSTFNNGVAKHKETVGVKSYMLSPIEKKIIETAKSSNYLIVENQSRIHSEDINEQHKTMESDNITCNKNTHGMEVEFCLHQDITNNTNEINKTVIATSVTDHPTNDAVNSYDKLNTYAMCPRCLNSGLFKDSAYVTQCSCEVVSRSDKTQCSNETLELPNKLINETLKSPDMQLNCTGEYETLSSRNNILEKLETGTDCSKTCSEGLYQETNCKSELLNQKCQNGSVSDVIYEQINKTTNNTVEVDKPMTVSNEIVEKEQVDERSSSIEEIPKIDQVHLDSSHCDEIYRQESVDKQFNFVDRIVEMDHCDKDSSCSDINDQGTPVDKPSDLTLQKDKQSNCKIDELEKYDTFANCNNEIVDQWDDQECYEKEVSEALGEISNCNDNINEQVDNNSICSEEPLDQEHFNKKSNFRNLIPEHCDMQWHKKSCYNDEMSEQKTDNSSDNRNESSTQECENLLCARISSESKSDVRKRQVLKRSLSDSAINDCMNNKHSQKENEENISFLWPFKRRKTNNIDSNSLAQDLCSIIQCNRRNSISSFYKEENVSFCILIDDSCIIAEENDEQEKICYAELTDDCLTEIQNDYVRGEDNTDANSQDISTSQQEDNCEYLDSYMMQDEDDKLTEPWIEDVGCVETIISDDIAENVEISGPSSPKDDYLSENDESGVFSNSASSEHTDKVKYIYGEKMCNDDAQFVETLYNTPQMDVNKTLIRRESIISAEYYDNDSLVKILSDSNDKGLPSNTRDYKKPVHVSEIDKEENIDIESPAKEIALDIVDATTNEIVVKNNTPMQAFKEDKILLSPETTPDNIFTYNENDDNTNYVSSSSPEVSSTTSEEKSSAILLKITNYKGSTISQVNDTSRDSKRSSCKFTEDKDYVQCHVNFPTHRPLLTKAAQKYIPPLKESMRDLKVKLSLPQHSLIKLKELKKSKEEPKLCKSNISVLNSKKPKPKFEDVLKSIDEIQFKMHKEKTKKTKKSIPKVVIKKNENGSHYASTSRKNDFNPDLTGRKWQPWVFIEKNYFIDKMALKKKTNAVYSHRKKTFVLAEKFQKYKSVNSANFVITAPISDCPSTGLKYTIRLKHNY